jgi:hypothetical protein
MAKYLKRSEGISVSHNFVAVLWRGHGLQPHRQGTFKLSRDPDFAVKVADVVGLYLDPPTGAVVLSMDEKTQVQALDRIRFLDQVIQRYPDKEIHVIVDNLSTQDGDDIDKWLKKHPHVTFHYTPTGSTWLNQREICSASSRDTPSVEAPLSRFGNSPDTSRTTSPTGTRRLNHSPGPQHPKRSSARSRSWNETSRVS